LEYPYTKKQGNDRLTKKAPLYEVFTGNIALEKRVEIEFKISQFEEGIEIKWKGSRLHIYETNWE